MCNEAKRIQKFIRHWKNHSVHELFPEHVMSRFQYEDIIPNHCIVCGMSLNHHEMWPPDRCPRCMCQACYHRKILSRINYRCIVSGESLPKHKIDSQMNNPREVEHNIIDGYARDYYTLIANKVIGTDLRFLSDEVCMYPAINPGRSLKSPGFIDADYRILGYQNRGAIPLQNSLIKHLPEPINTGLIPFQWQINHKLLPIKTKNKVKKVRFIPIRKKI